MPIRYGLVRRCTYSEQPETRQISIAFGNIVAEQFFGGWNQFQRHYHCFQGSIFLVKNNQIGPYPYE